MTITPPNAAPKNLTELQVALDLDKPPGPRVAAWRDEYISQGDLGTPLVNMCVEDLYARQLCYSCGMPADRLVADEFPWVCVRCADRA